MKRIGILTGDPELGNAVNRIGKRKAYLNIDKPKLNSAVVRFLRYYNKSKKYEFVKLTPDMINDSLFDKVDFMFYLFLDPVAAKILNNKTYTNLTKLINKYPDKVFPPPSFANLIADKCSYYKYLKKKQIPIVPFKCIKKADYMKERNKTNFSFVKKLHTKFQKQGWKGFIGKPVLGTSGRGFSSFPNFNSRISIFEVYKQMQTQLDRVFLEYDFPKLLYQEKHSEFGQGKRPEMKLYYIGTKYIYGLITYGDTYYEMGKGPKNTKFYLSKKHINDAQSFATKVLQTLKPLHKGFPMLVTRIDIGCCLDHTNNRFNSHNFFLNEVEFAPAYMLSALKSKTKYYIDHQIGKQMLKILNHKFKH